MKITSSTAALGCAAALMAMAASASAAPVTYNSGDLLIGFRVQGNPSDLVVNAGSSSQFRGLSANQTVTLNLGNSGPGIAADLSANYGGAWFSNSQVTWSLSGIRSSSDPSQTIYATRAEGSQPWTRFSPSGQSQPSNRFITLANAYLEDQLGNPREATANSGKATVINNTVDATTSYTFFTQPNDDFSYFPGGIESTVGSATGLDLYRLPPGTSGAGTFGLPGELLGTFAISNAGVVTFTAVPEPSVLALASLGLIGGLFYWVRRKRNAATA